MENTKGKLRYCSVRDGAMGEWAVGDGLDKQLECGYYLVEILHTEEDLGLPVKFCGDRHYILAHLLVTESGTGDKLQKNRVVGQTLVFTDRLSSATGVYSRSGEHTSNGVVWGEWAQAGNDGAKDVAWGVGSNINVFTEQGAYSIAGERLSKGDGLPIDNASPGHTVSARLVVIDSSISGTGDSGDKCVTQILALCNRTGGDGDVYVRTGSASGKNLLAGGTGWGQWGKLQTNVEVGQVTSLNGFTDNGIYSGVYTDGSSFFETFVMVVINNYSLVNATGKVRSISQFKYALGIDGTFSYKTRVGQGNTGISWGEWVSLGAASTNDIQDNSITAQKLSVNVREKIEKIEPLEKVFEAEKTALKNGDTIVGLAREVYSRQGKVDTATFQKRTTAGATSISDGVAKIKQIGGNIVKNLVDGTFAEGWVVDYGSATLVNGVVVFSSSSSDGIGRYSFTGGTSQVEIAGHVYYLSCKLKCSVAPAAGQVFVGAGNSSNVARENTVVYAAQNTDWQYLSKIFTGDASVNYRASVIGDRRTTNWGEICVKDYLLVDLTEMFGKGKEPTKDECDRMFSVLSALPQGLNFACPSALKSVGYNQWNPDNIIKNTGIVGDALEPDMPTNIAVVGCIPCKTGAGENNGYVIGYGEGDSWSDENIEVYFSPFNPLETDDELFMCRLEKDATYGTYVPKLNGYLLVVTPETAKFCVHLHWSGDREKMDYEDYVESNVALPVVPEMSEWGLAGISSDGAVNNDVIDLDRMVYIKRIGCVDLGDFNYYIEKITWLAYSNGNLVLYTPGSVGASSRGSNTFSIPELNYSYRVKCNYDAENDILTVNTASGNFTVGLVFTHDTSKDILRTRAAFTNSIAKQMCVLTDKYVTVDGDNAYYGVRNNKGVITATNLGRLQINDVALNGMDASQVKTYLKGVKAYYVLNTPEEYSIATKVTPNYIAGDYGVEEFIGGNVPFNSNILFYMRSLVNETRNFLDRLMDGLGSDITAVADKIVAAVKQHYDTEDAGVVDEDGLVEY